MNIQQKQFAFTGKTHSFSQKFHLKKGFFLIFTFVIWLFANCEEIPGSPNGEHRPVNQVKNHKADVAVRWINLQQYLIKTTAGFDPLVASRSFSYSGLTLYESVVKGMPGFTSVASPRIGTDINELSKPQSIYWPASANAAMASILKNLFANTSAANKNKIDSLELAFNQEFKSKITDQVLNQSAEYGRQVANQIFEWSKSDGGHEAYLSAINTNYVLPTGPGMWIPTSPTQLNPIRPYWGNNRSFVLDIAATTLPAPPTYSENPESDFYEDALEVYTTSLSLTAEDISIVKTWADLPGNYGTPAHYTNIATQLILANQFKLDEAVITYAKHGIALYEATICVFKAKYTYTLIRPVSYIRTVLGHTGWNTVIGTPPHPEYPSAHSVIGGASYVVLEGIFGKNYSFTDYTHENLYGVRTYVDLKAYAVEAANSRILGGIHFKRSAEIGLKQGEQVGALVNKIAFKK